MAGLPGARVCPECGGAFPGKVRRHSGLFAAAVVLVGIVLTLGAVGLVGVLMLVSAFPEW